MNDVEILLVWLAFCGLTRLVNKDLRCEKDLQRFTQVKRYAKVFQRLFTGNSMCVLIAIQYSYAVDLTSVRQG